VHREDGIALFLHLGAAHLGSEFGAEDLRFPHLHLGFDLFDVLPQRVLEPLHQLRVLRVLAFGRTRQEIGWRLLLLVMMLMIRNAFSHQSHIPSAQQRPKNAENVGTRAGLELTSAERG
jgi:hypothetical protein